MKRNRPTHISLLYFGLLLITIVCFNACEKPEGKGGKSTIKGRLYALNCYDSVQTVGDDDALNAQRVYLVYGDNSAFDDNMQTSEDGSFEFNYLRPGNYKIFAYSTDSNGAESAVIKEVVLGKNEEINIDPFVVNKLPDDGGGARITGRVKAKDYNTTFTQLLSEYYFADEYVYLVYGNNVGYATRIKTDYNGYYRFDNLRQGPYSVYVYSKDSTMTIPGGIVPVLNKVYLENNFQSTELPLITVFQ